MLQDITHLSINDKAKEVIEDDDPESFECSNMVVDLENENYLVILNIFFIFIFVVIYFNIALIVFNAFFQV